MLGGILSSEGEGEGADAPTATTPTDDMWTALSNERRRRTVFYINAHGRATISDVAEHVAAREHDTTVEQLGTDQRKRAYVALYQNHVPMLDEYGIVDVDDRNSLVEATEDTPAAAHLAEYFAEQTGDGRRVAADGGEFEAMCDGCGARYHNEEAADRCCTDRATRGGESA